MLKYNRYVLIFAVTLFQTMQCDDDASKKKKVDDDQYRVAGYHIYSTKFHISYVRLLQCHTFNNTMHFSLIIQ